MTEKEKRNSIFRTEKHKTKIKIYLGGYKCVFIGCRRNLNELGDSSIKM